MLPRKTYNILYQSSSLSMVFIDVSQLEVFSCRLIESSGVREKTLKTRLFRKFFW